MERKSGALKHLTTVYYILSALIRTLVSTWLPAKWLHKLSRYKLHKIVKAATKVPYYNSLFKSINFNANNFSLKEFRKLPILTKSMFRSNYPNNILASNIDMKKCFKQATSGSTGYPLELIYSFKTYIYYIITLVRTYFIVGYKPWQNIVYIKYEQLEKSNDFKMGPFFKTFFINSEVDPKEKIKFLREVKTIGLLASYPSSLLEICYHLSQEDRDVIRPKFISLNSEAVTEEQKSIISKAFQCPVYVEYSAQECWAIASECKQGAYHIFTDNVFLEIVDDNDKPVTPGEIGRIIITPLNNTVMPLIRYEIGDRGILSSKPCTCGLKFPVLERITGRNIERVILDSGNILYSLNFVHEINKFMKRFPGSLYIYQFIYYGHNKFELRIKPGMNFDQDHTKQLSTDLQNLAGEPIRIEIKLTDQFEKGPSGKMAYFINSQTNR